jgi:hypothetical protein
MPKKQELMDDESDILTEAERLLANAAPEKKGVVGRIVDSVRKSADKGTVEIDGETMTIAAGRLIEQGGSFIGFEFLRFVRVRGGHGMENIEVYDPRRHSPEEKATSRLEIREYVLAPARAYGYLTPGATPVLSAWMIIHGGEPREIGRQFSRNLFERLRQHGVLSGAGEKLLAEMSGAKEQPIGAPR